MTSFLWLAEESLFWYSRVYFLSWLHWCGYFLHVSMEQGELRIYSTIFPIPLCCCIINISFDIMSKLWITQAIQEPLCKYLSGSLHIEIYVFTQVGDAINLINMTMYIHFYRAFKWPLHFPVLIDVWISQYNGIKIPILSKSCKFNSSLMCLLFCFVLFSE